MPMTTCWRVGESMRPLRSKDSQRRKAWSRASCICNMDDGVAGACNYTTQQRSPHTDEVSLCRMCSQAVTYQR